eukprot:1149959-Pelagomonas_calceolata.AAC.12
MHLMQHPCACMSLAYEGQVLMQAGAPLRLDTLRAPSMRVASICPVQAWAWLMRKQTSACEWPLFGRTTRRTSSMCTPGPCRQKECLKAHAAAALL